METKLAPALETKKPWQSKSMVLNAIAGLISAVALFLPQASLASEFMAKHAMEIGLVWSVANIILRAITKDKIGLGE